MFIKLCTAMQSYTSGLLVQLSEGKSASRELTTRPAFLIANGKLSSPVPMLPFRMWIRVWKTLKVRQKHQQSPRAAADPLHLSSVRAALLTWFPIVLQTVRSAAAVWKVPERRGKERPFLRGSGLRVKALMERTKSRELHRLVQRGNPNALRKCGLTRS